MNFFKRFNRNIETDTLEIIRNSSNQNIDKIDIIDKKLIHDAIMEIDNQIVILQEKLDSIEKTKNDLVLDVEKNSLKILREIDDLKNNLKRLYELQDFVNEKRYKDNPRSDRIRINNSSPLDRAASDLRKTNYYERNNTFVPKKRRKF